jgi:two-component system, NarL family, sensor kinase
VTALAALALIPLRESLQRAVNRVVYGRWHEPYEVLAGLGERLEAAADVDRLLDAVVTELSTGLDLADVSVRGPDGASVAGARRPVPPRTPGPSSPCTRACGRRLWTSLAWRGRARRPSSG